MRLSGAPHVAFTRVVAMVRTLLLSMLFLAPTALLSGCTYTYANLTHRESEVDNVEMSAFLRRSGITITIANDTGQPIRVIWSDSNYVYADGLADRLWPINTALFSMRDPPRDQVVPARSSISAEVAPAGSIDALSGTVSIPFGPIGAAVRLVVAVEADGEVQFMDYTYVFEQR